MSIDVAGWKPSRRPWGLGDALALAAWTIALGVFFRDALFLGKALFFFDITEINYPYRDFLARSLKAGQFWRWHPGMYNGMPLFAESQAGYLHPLKYLLYPWMETWRALNLDTIGSIWLTGLAMYGWLRRHVGPAGALAGAALFGLSGFVWAHFIHTSMTNALLSVPLVFWGLEAAWDGGRLRGLGIGALALASQVFAGHLQDTILTSLAVGIVALCRAGSARGARAKGTILGYALILGGLGFAVAAVQWVPSKDLLDRSPRVGGLTYEQITYGSWAPELLPTLLVRETYGTLARDTDWQDGYYPYHEMNAYMGLIGLALAIVGAGAWRDRWVATWIVLAGLGGLFMLGKFTALFDYMNLVPVVGASRIPVRYHLWVSLAVAALGAVGVDRLATPGAVRLRTALVVSGILVAASVAIAGYLYAPIWIEGDRRWSTPEHREHFRWLGREVGIAVARTTALVVAAWWIAARAAKEDRPSRRAWLAAVLPILILADLLGSHSADVPTIDPSFFTSPPGSARRIAADPATIRVLGIAERSAAEPGFASRNVDFFEVRETLAWGLPSIWGLRSSMGHTPIYPRRVLTFHDNARPPLAGFDAEGVTQVVAGRPFRGWPHPPVQDGFAFIHPNPTAQPRARLMGRPAYVADEEGAGKALEALGPEIRDRLIVEDPTRPLPEGAEVVGSARIVLDDPERVEVEVDARTPAYLVLADTFDPGWSATLDGIPAPIRPAFSAFRAVFLAGGKHRIIFVYEPSGFRAGLIVTIFGLLGVLACLAWPRPFASPDPPHGASPWPAWWPLGFGGFLAAFLLLSAIRVGPGGVTLHPRWEKSVHPFTWSAGTDAIRPMSKALGR